MSAHENLSDVLWYVLKNEAAVKELIQDYRAWVLREAADMVAKYTGNDLDANAKMLRRAADGTPRATEANQSMSSNQPCRALDVFFNPCPNPVTIPPDPSHHNGGIACGCPTTVQEADRDA